MKLNFLVLLVVLAPAIVAQPTITSFSPSSGPVGTAVTIMGTNFNPSAQSNIVFFGAIKGQVTSATTTSIVATVPAGATYQPLSVTSNNLTAFSKLPFRVTFTGAVGAFGPTSFGEILNIGQPGQLLYDAQLDIDGDGKLDLAGTRSDGFLYMYRNTSTQESFSFTEVIQYDNSSWGPDDFIFIDLDGDGKPDLVTLDRFSICVRRNTSVPGTISFEKMKEFAAGKYATLIAPGDFNSDGKPDIALFNNYDTTKVLITILANNTSGTTISFSPKVDSVVAINPYKVRVADIDGDGKADICAINRNRKTYSVLRNTTSVGAISFAANSDFGTNNGPFDFSIGDLDNDGKPDAAVANWGFIDNYGNTISLLRNTSTPGNVSFSSKSDLAVNVRPMAVGINDMDGDGAAEVVAMSNGNFVSVFRNTSSVGAFSFANRADYNDGTYYEYVFLGDMNNDNFPDIILTNGASVFGIKKNKVVIPSSHNDPPVITGFSPLSGSAGTIVTIIGEHFSNVPGNNIVYFGAVKAAVTSSSLTSLTVTVPRGATYEPLSVTRETLTGFSKKYFNPTFAAEQIPFHEKTFFSKIDSQSASSPCRVVSADFDNDGKPDMVVSKTGLNIITVYRNTSINSNVSFGPKSDISMPHEEVGDIAIADINGDGKKDIVAVAYHVQVLLNTSVTGTISFSPAQSTAEHAQQVLTGDIDGDGRVDIVVTDGYGVKILRNMFNNNTVAFINGGTFGTSYASAQCFATLADFNSDGRPDLAVVNSLDNTVSILRNTSFPGAISFAAKVNYATGNSPGDISSGDFDGDGKIDIAVANNFEHNVSVFRNKDSISSISFENRINFSTGYYPNAISVADLDGDNRPDLVIANKDDTTISIHKNTGLPGSISFQDKVQYKAGALPLSVCAIDLNDDLLPDIVTANDVSNSLSIFRNNLLGPLITGINPLSGKVGTIVTITGFNFSGATSVKFGNTNAASFTIVSPNTITAVTGEGSNGDVTVTNNAGSISFNGFQFTPPSITSFLPVSGPVGTSVTITGSNFSSVPTNNVVYVGGVRANVTAASTNSLSVIVPAGTYQPLSVTTHNLTAYSTRPFLVTFGNGTTDFVDTSFGSKKVFTVPFSENSRQMAIGDIDGDGKIDIALTAPGTDSKPSDSVYIYRNTTVTNSLFSFASLKAFKAGFNPYSMAMGDIDRDGKPDLVIGRANVTAGAVVVLKNTSSPGTVSFAPMFEIPFSSAWESITGVSIEDFDSDGKPDIALIDNWNKTGYLKNFSSPTEMKFELLGQLTTEYFPKCILSNDIDGDRKPEIIYSTQTTANPRGDMACLLNKSTPGTIIFAPQGGVSDTDPYWLTSGDYNGDGKTDLASTHTTELRVFQNTGSIGSPGFGGAASFTLDVSTRQATTADFDGDGKPDIALSDMNSGDVSAFKNFTTSNFIAFKPAIKFNASLAQTSINNGDFDNDGKPDIVGYNSGNITILKNRIGEPLSKTLCPASATTITSNLTGSTYIWQLDTCTSQSCYKNTEGMAGISGSNTKTLSLANVPSVWYGYKFRCLVDGTPGYVTTFKFSNTWTGAKNNNWVEPQNWSCGIVPDANTDVIISSGPVEITTNQSCRSIKVATGVQLVIQPGGNLTITH